MSLMLTVYSSPAWDSLANVCGLPVITDAALATEKYLAVLRTVQPLSAVSSLVLQSQGNGDFLLAVVQAEHFLANAIREGEKLEEASAQWELQVNALLALQAQHRRRLKLFNLHQALTDPAAFRSALGSAAAVREYPSQSIDNSLELLAASQYVSQRQRLKQLNARLQASSLPLCDSEILTLDVDNVLEHSSAQLVAAKEERFFLLEQQRGLQQQLDKQTTEYNLLRKALQRTEMSLLSTKEERDLILSQLQQVQEQLEQYHYAVQLEQQKNEQAALLLQEEQQKNKHAALAHDKQHAKEIAKLESELNKTKARAASAEYAGRLLQEELEKLKSSTLWKATGPVRALGSLVKKADKSHEKLQQDCALLLTSEYFDIDWYLQAYPDVADSKMNPAEHYLLYGAAEGRLPGPRFDGNWYVQHYPDVASAGTNPLLHFIMFGQQEGRSSSPKLLTNNSQHGEE
ncbi:hypothetical protein ACSV5M_12790 [Cellvibrio sp. ARAG 10.3]|uniref:hypothetical protein n=1 Tax=Cellvibrio sp. ARAG 10.3 TaxID=3451358 RepID=UPI003F44A849